MYRFIGALSLLAASTAMSTATLAQTPTPKPAATTTTMPAKPDPAILNAKLAAPLPADRSLLQAKQPRRSVKNESC